MSLCIDVFKFHQLKNKKIYGMYSLISIVFLIQVINLIDNLYVEILVFIIGVCFLCVFLKKLSDKYT